MKQFALANPGRSVLALLGEAGLGTFTPFSTRTGLKYVYDYLRNAGTEPAGIAQVFRTGQTSRGTQILPNPEALEENPAEDAAVGDQAALRAEHALVDTPSGTGRSDRAESGVLIGGLVAGSISVGAIASTSATSTLAINAPRALRLAAPAPPLAEEPAHPELVRSNVAPSEEHAADLPIVQTLIRQNLNRIPWGQLRDLGQEAMKGGQYNVTRMELLGTGTDVVLRIPYGDMTDDDMAKEAARHLMHNENPGVAKLLGFTVTNESQVGLVVSAGRCTVGSLLKRADMNQIPRYNKLKLLLDVARALMMIHSRGYVHGDISPDNVILLVDADELVGQELRDLAQLAQIIDFGACTPFGESRVFANSTYGNMQTYHSPARPSWDWWSFAAFSVEVMVGASLGTHPGYGVVDMAESWAKTRAGLGLFLEIMREPGKLDGAAIVACLQDRLSDLP